MKLFSGTSNLRLAEKVSKLLGVSLAKAEVVRFENSEVRIRVEEGVKDQTAIVIQSISNPTDMNLMELFFFCDALKRSGAEKVIAIVPYFGYARQNIQHRPGEDVSAHVVIKFLETVGFSEVMCFDIHDEGLGGLFSVPFRNLSGLSLLATKIKAEVGVKDVEIVSPDQGGIERTRQFVESFFLERSRKFPIIEKKRDLEKIHQSKTLELFGDVKGKIVILVDDIITSGGTIINAAHLCFKNGAKKVVAAVVHHDFSADAKEKLQNSRIEKFFTTDTISLRKDQKFTKLEEISIAPLLADELKSLK